MAKLGFGDKKTVAPKNINELIGLLGDIMSAAVNNEVDFDNAKLALNAATRMVEAVQADTRMKALAIATQRTISETNGWGLVDIEQRKLTPEVA